SVFSTKPDLVGVAGDGAAVVAAGAVLAVVAEVARLPAPAGAGAGAVSTLALPGVRVFTFSTSTCLVRPWLKFWRTTLCSTPRGFSVRVLVEPTLSFLSGVFSVVSAIQLPIPGVFRGFRDVGPEALEARHARQKCLALGTGEQRCMYHIWPPKCQIQLRRGKYGDDGDGFGIGPLP